MSSIKFVADQAKCFNQCKNLRVKVQKCCANIYRVAQKKCMHSLLINIFGINLNEISISG